MRFIAICVLILSLGLIWIQKQPANIIAAINVSRSQHCLDAELSDEFRIESCQDALSQDSRNDDDNRYQLLALYAQNQDIENGLILSQSSVDLAPNESRWSIWQAYFQDKHIRKTSAIEVLFAEFNTMPDTRQILMDILYDSKDDKFLERITHALRPMFGGQIWFQELTAQIFILKTQYNKALNILAKSLNENPEHTRFYAIYVFTCVQNSLVCPALQMLPDEKKIKLTCEQAIEKFLNHKQISQHVRKNHGDLEKFKAVIRENPDQAWVIALDGYVDLSYDLLTVEQKYDENRKKLLSLLIPFDKMLSCYKGHYLSSDIAYMPAVKKFEQFYPKTLRDNIREIAYYWEWKHSQ